MREFLQSIHFNFNEVDVDFTGWDMFKTILLGTAIFGSIFLIKWIGILIF